MRWMKQARMVYRGYRGRDFIRAEQSSRSADNIRKILGIPTCEPRELSRSPVDPDRTEALVETVLGNLTTDDVSLLRSAFVSNETNNPSHRPCPALPQRGIYLSTAKQR